MGGKYALLLAINEPRLAACVSNYGSMPSEAGVVQRIHAPVLAIFGADDRSIPPSAIDAFVQAMEAANRTVDIKIYPHANRGFADPNNKLGYREAAAQDAWERTLAFLAHNLK